MRACRLLKMDVTKLFRRDFSALDPYHPVKPLEVLAEEIGVPVEKLVKLDANENLYGPIDEVSTCALCTRDPLAPSPTLAHLRRRSPPRSRRARSSIFTPTRRRRTFDARSRPSCAFPRISSAAARAATSSLTLSSDCLSRPPSSTCRQLSACTRSWCVVGEVRCARRAALAALCSGCSQGKLAHARILNVERGPAPDFGLHYEGIAAAVAAGGTVIYAASPNNPTGGMLTHEEVRKVSESASSRGPHPAPCEPPPPGARAALRPPRDRRRRRGVRRVRRSLPLRRPPHRRAPQPRRHAHLLQVGGPRRPARRLQHRAGARAAAGVEG